MTQAFLDFNAREIGAIGVTSRFYRQVDANSDREALMSLYATFEHISDVIISIPSKETRPLSWEDTTDWSSFVHGGPHP